MYGRQLVSVIAEGYTLRWVARSNPTTSASDSPAVCPQCDTTKRFLGTSAIAAWFDVLPVTVLKWRTRYPDFPPADVVVHCARGPVYGWSATREAELRQWHAGRTGPGHRSDLDPRRALLRRVRED